MSGFTIIHLRAALKAQGMRLDTSRTCDACHMKSIVSIGMLDEVLMESSGASAVSSPFSATSSSTTTAAARIFRKQLPTELVGKLGTLVTVSSSVPTMSFRRASKSLKVHACVPRIVAGRDDGLIKGDQCTKIRTRSCRHKVSELVFRLRSKASQSSQSPTLADITSC